MPTPDEARILDSLLEGCQVIGFDWKYLYLNDAAVKQARQTREQLIGRTMMEAYPGIEAAPFFALLRECLDKRTHHRLENEFTFPDGSKGWFELRIEPVPQGAFIFSMDTTHARRAENVVRESEERFRELFRNLGSGVLLLVPTGDTSDFVLRDLNAAAEQMTKLRREAALGKRASELFPGLAAMGLLEVLANVARTGEPARHPVSQYQDARISFWAKTFIYRLLSNEVVVIVEDVSEQRYTEEQLRVAQKMEAIGQLAGGVAHDFNNLLSVILSYSDFAIAGLRPTDPLREDIGEIRKAGEHAASLTRQLLAFSRKQMLQPEVLDLNEVLRGVEGMLRRLIGENIEFKTLLAADLGRVRVDPGQIEQVVMNLAVNARDAMPDGGRITVETANVELDETYASQHLAVPAGSHVVISVSDTGVGMDALTRSRLFEPFFTTKEVDKGTGLGLATVFGIVKQSGGNIWVYSEPGKGTTFKIYLPQVEGAPDTIARAPRVVLRATKNETLLVVEDEAAVRTIAKRILESAGYRVLTAANGGEALLACEREPQIDLVLTDVVMPQMSGKALVERLSGIRPGLKVLYMSGYTDNAIVHQGAVDPGTHFIGKPFNAAELTIKVRETLDAPG